MYTCPTPGTDLLRYDGIFPWDTSFVCVGQCMYVQAYTRIGMHTYTQTRKHTHTHGSSGLEYENPQVSWIVTCRFVESELTWARREIRPPVARCSVLRCVAVWFSRNEASCLVHCVAVWCSRNEAFCSMLCLAVCCSVVQYKRSLLSCVLVFLECGVVETRPQVSRDSKSELHLFPFCLIHPTIECVIPREQIIHVAHVNESRHIQEPPWFRCACRKDDWVGQYCWLGRSRGPIWGRARLFRRAPRSCGSCWESARER